MRSTSFLGNKSEELNSAFALPLTWLFLLALSGLMIALACYERTAFVKAQKNSEKVVQEINAQTGKMSLFCMRLFEIVISSFVISLFLGISVPFVRNVHHLKKERAKIERKVSMNDFVFRSFQSVNSVKETEDWKKFVNRSIRIWKSKSQKFE